jgi:hypothetical protein
MKNTTAPITSLDAVVSPAPAPPQNGHAKAARPHRPPTPNTTAAANLAARCDPTNMLPAYIGFAGTTLPPLALHSVSVIEIQPLPLQEFWPAHEFVALLQEPLPLHEFTPSQ